MKSWPCSKNAESRGIYKDVDVDIQQLSCNAKCQVSVEETRQAAGGQWVA